MPSMFRLLSPSLLLAEYHGQPASAYRFWQGVFLPSFVAVDMAEPSRDLSSKDLQKVSLPTSHFPPLRPAAHDLPQGGQPESFHRRVTPARTFPVDTARKDVPLLMIGLECGAANQRLVPLTTISCARTVPIRITTPAALLPCSTGQETLRAARDFLNPILPITEDGGGRLSGSSENDRSPFAQRSLRPSSRNLG